MRLRLLAAGTVASLLALTACGGHDTPNAAPSSAIPTVSAIPTSASPTPTPVPTSPLTGLPVTGPAPVVAVKIDNVYDGAQTGLNSADLVYVEQVEGGLTRLLAVFSGHLPTSVGPVRSARQSDLELLGEFGKIALAFSGANAVVVQDVEAANVVDDDYDHVEAGYLFNNTYPSPYQFLANVADLAAHNPGADTQNIGFTFGDAPTVNAAHPYTAGTSLKVTYPAAVIGATYDPTTGLYLMSRNGNPEDLTGGGQADATNILIQYVQLETTRLVDHDGNPTPFSVTVGSGNAVLLRGGRAFPGAWSRANQTSPTHWGSDAGGALPLAPGRTWILLVPIGTAVSTS